MPGFIRLTVLIVGTVALLVMLGRASPSPASQSDLIEYQELEAAPKIGRAAAATLLQGNVQLLAPGVLEQLEQLAEELAKAADLTVRPRVHVINDSLANLMTLPSGDIFIFAGFLDMIENRDELAFGLAHEIAHLRLNHGLSQMKKASDLQRRGALISTVIATIVASAAESAVSVAMLGIPVGVALPIFAKGVIEPVSAQAARIAAQAPEAVVAYITTASLGAYSRDHEEEADRLALVIMKRAKYNPAAAIRVMEKFSNAWHTR